MKQLLNWLTGTRTARRPNARPRRARRDFFAPRLEGLEERLCPTTTIDARALTLGSVTLSNTGTFSTAQVQTFNLAAGSYTLANAAALGGAVTFNVASDGSVSFDPSEAGVLAVGATPSTLVVHGRTITIDGSKLSIDGVGLDLNSPIFSLDKNPVFTATLLPGAGQLLTGANEIGSVGFNVGMDGSVSFDPSEAGVLAVGATPSTLVVNGRTITIDGSKLSIEGVGLDLNSRIFNLFQSPVFSATLLPGAGHLLAGANEIGSVTFGLGMDGSLSIPASESAAVSVDNSTGPPTLTVNGYTITIDVTKLEQSTAGVGLDLNSRIFTTATTPVFSATLLPGAGHLLTGANEVGSVTFDINPDGTIGIPAAEAGVLAADNTTGPPTLTVNGCTITLDASKLSVGVLSLNEDSPFLHNTKMTLAVLPGSSQFLCDAVATGARVTFNVGLDSSVSFPTTETNVLAVGATPSTLVVKGCPVHFNAKALALPTLDINHQVSFSSATVFAATLLPGPFQFVEDPSNHGSFVYFTIQPNGTFTFNTLYQQAHVLGGRATKTLILLGEPIRIDATALAAQGIATFTVAGAGTYSTAAVQTLTLLPGWQIFSAGSVHFNFLVQLVDPLTGAYDTVNYDPALSNILSGLDTSTLVVT
jgi:hypothetical protein